MRLGLSFLLMPGLRHRPGRHCGGPTGPPASSRSAAHCAGGAAASKRTVTSTSSVPRTTRNEQRPLLAHAVDGRQQIVDGADRLARGDHDQVAPQSGRRPRPGCPRRPPGPGRRPEPAGPRRRAGGEPRAAGPGPRRDAAGSGSRPAPGRPCGLRRASVHGQSQVEAVPGPMGVDGHEPAVGVDQRTAGRTPAQRGGVLDAVGDQPAAWPAEAAAHDETVPKVTRTPPAAGRQGQGQHRPAQSRCAVGPRDRSHVSGVDGDDGQVTVDVDALHGAGHGADRRRR